MIEELKTFTEELVLFTENLIKYLVSDPEMVKVKDFTDDEGNIILEIIVPSEDMGRVVGRSGKNIQAIRTLIQATAYNKGLKKVKINVDSF